MAEEKENLDDVEISRKGIDLMINNDLEACEKLFTKHKDYSFLTNYCYSFMSYTKALLTQDDQQIEKAIKDTEYAEKLCSEQSNKAMPLWRKALSMTSSNGSNSLGYVSPLRIKGIKSAPRSMLLAVTGPSAEDSATPRGKLLEEKFTKAILIADCKVNLAILGFLKEDMSPSALLQMRKSWRIYAKVQKKLYQIYKKMEPNAEQIYGSDSTSANIVQWSEETNEASASNSEDASNQDTSLNELNITDEEIANEGAMSLETVKRLLGAVSFGYGLFQICLSFAPPNLLKLIKVFGFEGDRNAALKAINFTSNSRDMRAPFADLVLLWYSTVAIPLFGTNDGEISIDTKSLLERNLTKYPQSSLFLYMKGKYYRSILRDLAGSIACYERAADCAMFIKEVKLISLYEIGWIHVHQLSYAKAIDCFDVLHLTAKWARWFSTYVCAVLHSANGNFESADYFCKEALKIMAGQKKHKNNPAEGFALKRTEYIKKNPIKTTTFPEMLVCELLYVWVCYPYMEEASLKKTLEFCNKMTDKNFMPMKLLFEGSIHKALKNVELSEKCFNESIALAKNGKKPPFGSYALPCAYYELAYHHTELKNYAEAKTFLAKAQGCKDYEFEIHFNSLIRSLQIRVKQLTEGARNQVALRTKP